MGFFDRLLKSRTADVDVRVDLHSDMMVGESEKTSPKEYSVTVSVLDEIEGFKVVKITKNSIIVEFKDNCIFNCTLRDEKLCYLSDLGMVDRYECCVGQTLDLIDVAITDATHIIGIKLNKIKTY